MADTGIHGPTSNTGISGMTNFSQPQRLHETTSGASATGFSGANRGHIWKGFFSSEIPTGATVDGFELISTQYNSSRGNIGNFGSSGATESTTFTFHLWNGTSLSSAIAWQNVSTGISGIALNGDSTEVTFTGSNKRHPALPSSNQGNDTVMAGSPTETGGLSWTVSSQADWGFGLKIPSVTNTPVYGAIRGLGLKCYFTEAATGYSNNVIGVASANIAKVKGVATVDIAKVIGVS
tara:strand:- start:230 stop:937 length:708 start_codon:yes stop_codon:yes gene_type:complete